MEKVCFKVEGEHFTHFIKSLAQEPNLEKSWGVFLDSFLNESAGLTEEYLFKTFKSILKGDKKFIGTNTLQLVEDNSPSILETILENIAIAEDKEELKFYAKVKPIPKYLKDECFLKPYSSHLKHDYGWITKAGLFLPVDYQGHISFLYNIEEEELVPENAQIGENHWIQISTENTIFCKIKKPTKEQLITLKNYLQQNKENYFKEGNFVHIHGLGIARLRDNDIYIEDIFGEYQEKSKFKIKDTMKRISFQQAQKLHSLEYPIFIYEHCNFKKINSLSSFFTENKELFCQKKDLYKNE